MELTGKTIDARPSGTPAIWLLAGASVLLLFLAISTDNVDPAMAAILPAILAVGIWLRQPRRLALTFDERGIHHFGENRTISYESIYAMSVNGAECSLANWREPTGPLVIHYAGGRLAIPQRTSVPMIELFRYVLSRLPPRSAEPPRVLADFVAEHAAKFGSDKVEIIRARRTTFPGSSKGGLTTLGWAMVATATMWFVIAGGGRHWLPQDGTRDRWLAVGTGTLLAGLFVLVLAALLRRAQRTPPRMQGACIVITPAGMAMTQGDLKGALRWDEVTRVVHTPRSSIVWVLVHGGKLSIRNVYERSLDEIATLIRRQTG